ncbi:MAG TPA: ABC transporter ATP-binding protein [Gemmatimonadaceae bacterium]|nr:ABC transporter ATP-binding protein [Gemmatimonadaceae bacterium]
MTAPAIPHDEEVLGRAFDRRLARRLFAYARPYAKLVAGALALLLVAGVLQLAQPLLTRHVIDVAVPARDTAALRRDALLFIGVLAAQFACEYGQVMLTSLLGQRVMHDLRREIFDHLQRLSIAFFDRNPVGRLVTRVTSDVEALNELFTSGVVAGLGDLFTLVAISALMFAVDWRLTLAAFGVVPFIYLTSHVFRIKVRDSYRDIRTRLARINAFLQERLTGMRIVQLFGRERAEGERFAALNRAHLDAHLKSVTVYALYFPVIEILTTVALASLIVAAVPRVASHVLTVGTVAAFLQLARRFFQPLQDLSDKYNTLQQAMAASERVFRLLDIERQVGDGRERRAARSSSERREAAARGETRGVTVTFEDVWFHYGTDGAAEPVWVLKGVSFTARPGQTLALVGHTGAGKTTVISLLLRFYDPQRGGILVDGRDIREMALDELRALAGYVQQDIFLFAGDIASNIRLAAPLSDAEVADAAAQVGADRVIRRLPDGYRHRLGERGASVSVGERQLLSFARAVAADPALLLLDEATSAVDSEIEAEIQRALARLMRGRTTIAIAHRLSTIVAADEILVLHHGEIRERGRHRDLLGAHGLYARLYRLQTGEFADGERLS